MNTTSSNTISNTLDNSSSTRTQNIYENLAYGGGGNELSYDFAKALEISRRDEERREQLRKQEDEELERILQLSLVEK